MCIIKYSVQRRFLCIGGIVEAQPDSSEALESKVVESVQQCITVNQRLTQQELNFLQW